jgi:signal transduction histidine kinase
LSPALRLKESSRDLIAEIARALEPRFAEITEAWRTQVIREFGLEPRALAALKRLTIATGCNYFSQNDFPSFFENLTYYGTRLAKLEVDTRTVARSLEIYQSLCDPHLESLFRVRCVEAAAALETLTSATFITVSGAYFDAKTAESDALLAVIEAEFSAQDVSSLLKKTLETVARTFRAGTGALLLKDLETEALVLEASIGMGLEEYGVNIRVGEGFSGYVAQTGESQIVLDTTLDERIISPTLRNKSKTLWGVPLKGGAGCVGVLILGFAQPYYEWLPRERQLVQAMADRAAMVIERARMIEALREREALIARLSGHLLTAQEEERKRISRELHDETGQALMVIRLYLGMLEGTVKAQSSKAKIKETVEVVDRTVEGLRRMISKLSPLVLQELGLVAAIRKEAKDMTRNTGVKARVAIPSAIGRFQAEIETGIYRIVQEALHNVAKHAEAKSVNIQMSLENGELRLVVEDDGVGMGATGAQKNSSRGHSYGLAGIKERVSMLNGSVRVCSVKGQGTRIEISVPAPYSAEPPNAKQLAAGGTGGGPTLVMKAAASQGTA